MPELHRRAARLVCREPPRGLGDRPHLRGGRRRRDGRARGGQRPPVLPQRSCRDGRALVGGVRRAGTAHALSRRRGVRRLGQRPPWAAGGRRAVGARGRDLGLRGPDAGREPLAALVGRAPPGAGLRPGGRQDARRRRARDRRVEPAEPVDAGRVARARRRDAARRRDRGGDAHARKGRRGGGRRWRDLRRCRRVLGARAGRAGERRSGRCGRGARARAALRQRHGAGRVRPRRDAVRGRGTNRARPRTGHARDGRLSSSHSGSAR